MKIKALEIKTTCLAELYRFYTGLLSLPAVRHPRQIDGAAAAFTLSLHGGTLFTFEQTSQSNPYYHFAFNIAENKIEEALSWVKNKGIEPIEWNGIVIHDFKNWNAHSFYFFDPAGNIVEFIARHDLKDTYCEAAFDASHILSVSEIGWVLDDVPVAVQAMQTELGLPLYYSEGDSRRFAAMGDPRGLFILVEKGRAWFPTRRPAQVFPMKVIIEKHTAAMPAVWEHYPAGQYPYRLEMV